LPASGGENKKTRASEDVKRGFRIVQYSLGKWITLLVK
jgi:hypothetical protein